MKRTMARAAVIGGVLVTLALTAVLRPAAAEPRSPVAADRAIEPVAPPPDDLEETIRRIVRQELRRKEFEMPHQAIAELARDLELDLRQVERVSGILADHRAELADVFLAASLDRTRGEAPATPEVEMRKVFDRAYARMHSVLRPEQYEKYLGGPLGRMPPMPPAR